MPVMDGFAATEKILAAAAEQGRSRPHIIALTADATQATRQHCKEVGMDDYLVKPIDFGKLQRAIDNWLPGSELRVVSERHQPEEKDAGSQELQEAQELKQIDTRSFAKLKENMGDISPVIRVFLNALPVRLRELQDAAGNADFENLRRVAHTLKGSSSQFGAVYLSNLCMRVENMAKNKMLDGVDALLQKIGPAADMVGEFLSEQLDKK